jgi:hypothetical protein
MTEEFAKKTYENQLDFSIATRAFDLGVRSQGLGST